MSGTDRPHFSGDGAPRHAQHRSRSLGLLGAVVVGAIVVVVVVFVVLYLVGR
jgi:predicted tellurium resistance membrane protein TerC